MPELQFIRGDRVRDAIPGKQVLSPEKQKFWAVQQLGRQDLTYLNLKAPLNFAIPANVRQLWCTW
jgi:hypothetical protein